MSYGRMSEEQARLEAKVRELLERAEAVDQEEDARFGEGQRAEDLPEERRRPEERLRRIRQAKAELEAQPRARQRAADESRSRQRKTDETRARRCGAGRPGRSGGLADKARPAEAPGPGPDGTPHPKAQRNFTDPDSRIIERGGSFLQGYNCQAAVDEGHQVIVAQAVTNQCPDNGNLLPLLDQVEQLCGQFPGTTTADAGYWCPQADSEGTRRGTER